MSVIFNGQEIIFTSVMLASSTDIGPIKFYSYLKDNCYKILVKSLQPHTDGPIVVPPVSTLLL